MSGLGSTPEVYVKRKSSPDPYTAPLSRRVCVLLLGLMIAAVLVLFVVQFMRGFVNEYRAVRVSRDQALERNQVVEGQLAEMMRHGDQGILLTRLNTDMGPAELRLVLKGTR